MLHLQIFPNKSNQGFVALMSVLIISAMGTIISLSLLSMGTAYGLSSLALLKGYSARGFAESCSNVALEKIRLDIGYSGDENIYFGSDRCEILPVIQVEGVYTVRTQGVVDLIMIKNKVIVTRTEDPETFEVDMSVESWQEVTSFSN